MTVPERETYGGAAPGASSFVVARRLFFFGLGVVYAAAFLSLWVQVHGLVGENGIAPASELLERAWSALGRDAYIRLPTLLWLGSSDAALDATCGAGLVCAVLIGAGLVPRPALVGAWLLYLSLCSVGDVFLGYQWDALLLETGLFALPLAPAGRGGAASWRRPVGRVSLLLLRWLLFRLMFASGVVKLASGDEAWWGLRALDFHYYTQPIPSWTSWFAHHAPHAFHASAVVTTLAIELLAPFLIFAPAFGRRIGFVVLVGLQVVIAATGSYGFFNLLTVTLCLLLLDDAVLARFVPSRLRVALWLEAPLGRIPGKASQQELPRIRAARLRRAWAATRAAALAAFAVATFALSGAVLLGQLGLRSAPSGAIDSALEAIAPLRSINRYGLFAVMTTQRDEIVIEGSRDGREWSTYAFVYKPGELDRRPAFAGLHMPRLDWQMWFASLGTCQSNRWFHSFLLRLLEGSDDVTAMLAVDPFDGRPPKLLRTTLHRYEFSPPGSGRRASHEESSREWEVGAWWQSIRRAAYCPTVTAVDGALRVVEAVR